MIEAVIFDLDGTILDNEGEWETAFMAVVNNYQLTVDSYPRQPNGWIHEPGLGLASNWRNYINSFNTFNKSVDELVRETVAQYSKLSQGLGLREGAAELVQWVKDRGWQTALCTGSAWYVVERELEELGLQLAFDVTTTGEEALMSKPDPEIFLLTAQKLNIEPKNCLVIEDAVAGVRAAAEAGMRVVGLESEYAPRAMLVAAGAAQTTSSLAKIQDLNL